MSASPFADIARLRPDRAVGALEPAGGIAVFASGNVGIAPGGTPEGADKLQVIGDIRVGTTGTNGCIGNLAGTGIAGTCSSDERLKRDITPFGSVLGPLPELVVTGEDGFKAIDCSKLPLLTIQAVKELEAENDALKQRVADLKQLFIDAVGTAARR